jgi:D-serine deaminase-like pyridoxal phosphate-dependent protein
LSFHHLQTPALILDRARMQQNLDTMHTRMRNLGVDLRPHLKTAKSAEIARLATFKQSGGITVSTLAEAEYFHAHGFKDILYAVGILPAKLNRVDALSKKGADIKLVSDSLDTVKVIAARSEKDCLPLKILIEVDSGEGRAGILADDPDFLEIARLINGAPNMNLMGVMTHAGHSYNCQTIDAIKDVAAQERKSITAAASILHNAGLPCPIVSAGSTPTAVHADNLEGVTEMRPGVFVFNDLKQLSVGSCSRGNLALSVLASVIGQNKRKGHIILDSGALALSKDISAQDDQPDIGYGEVCHAETMEPFHDLYVEAVSQEHGIVPVKNEDAFKKLPIGTQVRILPNHACITAAGYNHYEVLENGRIIAQWHRVTGW